LLVWELQFILVLMSRIGFGEISSASVSMLASVICICLLCRYENEQILFQSSSTGSGLSSEKRSIYLSMSFISISLFTNSYYITHISCADSASIRLTEVLELLFCRSRIQYISCDVNHFIYVRRSIF